MPHPKSLTVSSRHNRETGRLLLLLDPSFASLPEVVSERRCAVNNIWRVTPFFLKFRPDSTPASIEPAALCRITPPVVKPKKHYFYTPPLHRTVFALYLLTRIW